MLVYGQMFGEENTSGIDASIASLLPEPLLDVGLLAQQPEDAFVVLLQQLTPEAEHLGRDFVGLAEIGKDDGIVWQSPLVARGLLGGVACGIVGLVAALHAQNFLAVEVLIPGWNHHRVGQDVVKERHP